jgi:hypothetical protein
MVASVKILKSRARALPRCHHSHRNWWYERLLMTCAQPSGWLYIYIYSEGCYTHLSKWLQRILYFPRTDIELALLFVVIRLLFYNLIPLIEFPKSWNVIVKYMRPMGSILSFLSTKSLYRGIHPLDLSL